MNKKSTEKLFIPTTSTDVARRAVMRVGFCAVPYLLVAFAFANQGDPRLLQGFWLWFCVIFIPVAGIVLDLWRLQRSK